MKISFCLDINKNDADSGKHKFFIRLAKEMKGQGVSIVSKNADVNILLAGHKSSSNAKINVLRLDGLIMNNRWDYRKKNKKILKSIKQSDAIVYQGNFCKKAYETFLDVRKTPSIIIPNGASVSEFYNRNPKDFFLANCKWRPHKRLKAIVESFLIAVNFGLKSDLIITGKPDYNVKHPRIKYIKWQNAENLKKLLSEAIASLHLTWLDWCPNSMIEAIVAECPVIYTKSGGQTELGNGSGIGIEDTQWKFDVIDLYSPPKINKKEVAKSMLFLEKNKNITYKKRDDLNIGVICDQYIKYFETLLK